MGIVVRGRGVEIDEPGCEQDRRDSEDEEHEAGKGDETIGVRRPAVRIVLHAPDELRDEDSVEGPTDDEDVEDIGHRVAQ